MGVILQYRLDLPTQGLTVSNNVFRGQYVLDATITAEQACGWPGSAFQVAIENLPEPVVKKLAAAIGKGKPPLPVKLSLGYFEGPFAPVMDGLVQEVKAAVKDGKLTTTLTGNEAATQNLSDAEAKQGLPSGLTAGEAVERLLKDALPGRPAIERKLGSELADKLPERVRQGSLLAMLDEVARLAQAELFVVDGAIWMGQPVERTDYLPPELDLDFNLAGFEPFDKQLPKEIAAYHLTPLPAETAQGFRFQIAGDPRLRPGHPLSAAIAGYEQRSGKRFRATCVKHIFGASGYLCEGLALRTQPNDKSAARAAKAVQRRYAADVSSLVTKRIKDAIKESPFVVMGQIKEHQPAAAGGEAPHRASLFHGQEVGREILPSEPQPSVRAEVRQEEKEVFKDKPLLSPFAWHKCGLVVPVYPGMKAVLLHNLGRAEDPVVGGYVWSEKPEIEPPKAEKGDWWLCLPADYDGADPPTAATKATNDLTGSDGKRVIEAKGLRITVGEATLRPVGVRPGAGRDDELVIEHASGTLILVARDGKVTIKAPEVSIEGDLKIQGNVDIKGNVDIQ